MHVLRKLPAQPVAVGAKQPTNIQFQVGVHTYLEFISLISTKISVLNCLYALRLPVSSGCTSVISASSPESVAHNVRSLEQSWTNVMCQPDTVRHCGYFIRCGLRHPLPALSLSYCAVPCASAAAH